jgi:CRISPR-associated protein Cmr3
MTIWIMEPRDPLLVGDGRPFGPDPGARAFSLPFPFPSTIAGGIRARAAVNEEGIFQYTRQRIGNDFRFTDEDKKALDHLKKLQVRGPLLVQLAADSEDIAADAWLISAPGDALLLPSKSAGTESGIASVKRLVPAQLPQGTRTDLDQQALRVVRQLDSDDQRKPLQPLTYWYWERFKAWLLDPSRVTGEEVALDRLGLHGPEREQRIHVSIEAGKGIARDGRLFETSGLEFTAPGSGRQRLTTAKRLAVAVDVDENGYTIRPGVAGFGGERRMVTWRKSNAQLPEWTKDLETKDLAEALAKDQHCRLFLLTPGCFRQNDSTLTSPRGYCPGSWFYKQAEEHGVVLELKACVVRRPQVVSGWDLAQGRQGSPKPSRRLAPAGTVFFLSLKGDEQGSKRAEKQAIRDWIEATWMKCISDEEQDRRDGFGLAALGTWSGQLAVMQ